MRDSGFHRWRHAERLMDAGEVVVHVVQGDGCGVILEFLRERVRQAREPADRHPHG